MVQDRCTKFTITSLIMLEPPRESNPALQEHANTMVTERIKTGKRLADRNQMVGLAFQPVAALHTKLDAGSERWCLASIRGHAQVHKLFPLFTADLAMSNAQQMIIMPQLFDKHTMVALSYFPCYNRKSEHWYKPFQWKPFKIKYVPKDVSN